MFWPRLCLHRTHAKSDQEKGSESKCFLRSTVLRHYFGSDPFSYDQSIRLTGITASAPDWRERKREKKGSYFSEHSGAKRSSTRHAKRERAHCPSRGDRTSDLRTLIGRVDQCGLGRLGPGVASAVIDRRREKAAD